MAVGRYETQTIDPYSRGLELGRFGGEQIAANVTAYTQLFEAVSVAPDDLAGLGESAVKHVDAWSAELSAELRGLAAGAGLPLWQLGMLNARTEILATVGAVGQVECSTVVMLPEQGAPRTVQTWDWHDASNRNTLVVKHTVRPGHDVRYFTEYGILGKIGVNSAGIGVHFNILSHEDDGDGIGVPVHVVARTVMDWATTLDEAIEIACSAEVTASTVLTIVANAGGVPSAVCVELSPGGTALVPAHDGSLMHTNHFLDPRLARGERMPATSTTFSRYHRLRERTHLLAVADPLERVAAMVVHEPEGADVCCHPDPALDFQNRWETLLTISLDVVGTHLEFHEGGPCTASRESWQVF